MAENELPGQTLTVSAIAGQPIATQSSSKFENRIKLIGTVLTTLTLILGVLTYIATQKWESAKFITQKLETFAADKDVQLAQEVLDYNSGILHITATDSFYFNDDLLQNALAVDGEHTLAFTPEAYALRQIIDNYLSKLSVFDNYYELGLSDNRIIATYLKYYVDIIGDRANPRKSPDLRCHLWRYIDHYKYSNVQKLCSKYGYNIKPSQCSIKEDI